MNTLKRTLPIWNDRFLTHAIVWLAILLVGAIVAFGAFYYIDRRPTEVTDPVERALSKAQADVQSNPQDLGARLGLAGIYYDKKMYAEAADQYQVALQIDEKNLVGFAGLGRSLAEAGQLDAAKPNFQTILEKTKDSDVRGDLVGMAYFYLGKIALRQGDSGEAVKQLRQAIATDGADADAMELLGEALVAQGNYDEALNQLTRASQFVPDFRDAYEQMAIVYDAKKMPAEARYARAMSAYSSGDYKRAESELKAVAKALPSAVDVQVGLGLTLEKRGDRQNAIAAYQNAYVVDPSNFSARSGLVRLGAIPTDASDVHNGMHFAGTDATPAATATN